MRTVGDIFALCLLEHPTTFWRVVVLLVQNSKIVYLDHCLQITIYY